MQIKLAVSPSHGVLTLAFKRQGAWQNSHLITRFEVTDPKKAPWVSGDPNPGLLLSRRALSRGNQKATERARGDSGNKNGNIDIQWCQNHRGDGVEITGEILVSSARTTGEIVWR